MKQRLSNLRRHTSRLTAIGLLTTLLVTPALAQRGLKDIPSTDPADELKSFKVADGFEVNLFASEPMIAKPIQINFDSKGRLWVASSSIYPQIKPGEVADDKVIVLEDTDGDGKADKHTVFADGLLIPTAVIADPTTDGAYVANSTEMLHLQDTDGDGKADKRTVVLSGFGTEDTHHILHTFRWGVDGLLYMNQSIYIHSHIETPYGVRRLNGGGIWHFRPETLQLEIFCKGQVNSWGHHQDRWGQSFTTDGAYNQGINYTFPGAVFATSPGAKRILTGLNRGQPKHCGLEILSGRHLPEDWRGSFVTNDFRGNRINRFTLKEDGSGYQSIKVEDVLTSTHVAFRPVDVKVGPDGAIYIADWYNPIIQHGEVDFRDDRRDHTHGRIWRISKKDSPLVKPPKLVGAPIDELLAALKSPEDFTRLHAKLQLKTREKDDVAAKLGSWVSALDRSDARFEHLRLEALWAHQAINAVNEALLRDVLRSADHRARAAATRVLYHWHDRVPEALPLLRERIEDEHPRVRLEAVHALRQLDSLEAAEVAMRALDKPMDEFLDFALWQTARELSPHWLPALKRGEKVFDGNVKHLTFAFKAVESPDVVKPLLQLVEAGDVPAGSRRDMLTLIASLGDGNDLAAVFAIAMDEKTSDGDRVELLNTLADVSRTRNVKPAGDLSALAKLFDRDDTSARTAAAAVRLAGQWKLEAARPALERAIRDDGVDPALRQAAFDGLAMLGGAKSRATLLELSAYDQPTGRRAQAAVALAAVDLKAGAGRIVDIMTDQPGMNPAGLLRPVLSRKQGPAALAAALKDRKLSPDTAKLAVRTVNSAGREMPQLLQALMDAGGLTTPKRELSAAEMNALIDEVAKRGNPARGEAIYRRDNLRCIQCHAIGGAGGAVGPDLTSLGASAPVDYIIESLINPAAKVKEGYHAKQVETDDGNIIVGVFQRKTDSSMILRNSEDQQVSIPLDSIVREKDAKSIMPPGQVDALLRQELIDLVAFMAQLGKEGEYKVGNERFIRTWRTPLPSAPTADFYRHHGMAGFPKVDAVQWQPVYSQVAGDVPWNDVTKAWINGPRYGLLRGQLSVTTPGKIALKLSRTKGVEAWLGKQRLDVSAGRIELDAPKGEHDLVFALLEGQHPRSFRVELVDVENSPARAKVVNGK